MMYNKCRRIPFGEGIMRLLIHALIKYIAGLLLVGGLLFLPAGTLSFANGILFIGLLFLPMLVLGVVLFVKSPELLEKRLNVKEKERIKRVLLRCRDCCFWLALLLPDLIFVLGGPMFRALL